MTTEPTAVADSAATEPAAAAGVVATAVDAAATGPTTGGSRMEPLGGPREVLARFREAAIDQSVDGMRRLYAADAVHEFPFHRPGVPAQLTGRDEIVAWTTAGWRTRRIVYDGYRTLAIHDTGDPATIVVEQQAVGRNLAAGTEFILPNIVVLTVRSGRICHLRDYVNLVAVDAALR